MQRHRLAVQCSAIALPFHALPTPSESIRCPCRAAQLRAGQCLAVARHCESAHCLSSATPYTALPPPRGPLSCHAPLRCRLCPAAALQVSTSPMRCDSLRNLAPSGLCSAPALPGQAQSGDAPIVATAVPCQASPTHCRAKLRPCVASPCHRTALFCHRVAPNAAQFLAIALQVRATQRLCQAWQSLLCRRCTKRSYAVALRRGLHIAFAAHRLALPAQLPVKRRRRPDMHYLCLALNALPRRRSA